MISKVSLSGLILVLQITVGQCGNCTKPQQYLQDGESLVALTKRCACIDDVNDDDKVYNFAIDQLCKSNWLTITTETYESTCINQAFGATTKQCCDYVTTSELLQLPVQCLAMSPPPTSNNSGNVANNTGTPQGNGGTANSPGNGGNSSNIPEYLAGFLIPFLVGICGSIFAYMKGWCSICVKTLPGKNERLKRMLTWTTKPDATVPATIGDCADATKGDIESTGIPKCIEFTDGDTQSMCLTITSSMCPTVSQDSDDVNIQSMDASISTNRPIL